MDTRHSYAAYGGHNDVVTTLCQEGVNKDLQDNDGYTALIWAAKNGHYYAMRIILTSYPNYEALACMCFVVAGTASICVVLFKILGIRNQNNISLGPGFMDASEYYFSE